MKYKCYVSTVGNPDRGQYAPISNPEWIESDTIQGLRGQLDNYQEEWDIGVSNWKNPIVYEVHGKTKKKIGSMSYNLRIWVKQPAIVGNKYIEGVEFEF